MRYISGKGKNEIDDRWNSCINNQYEDFGMTLEIEDEDIKAFIDKVYAEPDFEVRFRPLSIKGDLTCKTELPVLLATLGAYIESDKVSHYYDISEARWRTNLISRAEVPWICCYSYREWTPVSYYLNCIDSLHQVAKALKLRLVMIGHVESRLPYFQYRSIADKVINQYLQKYESLYLMEVANYEKYLYQIPKKRSYEPYQNQIIYGELSQKKLAEKIRQWECKKKDKVLERDVVHELYQDCFYERIPPRQKIYVLISLLNGMDGKYYGELGLNTIYMGYQYALLYDDREKIDKYSESIQKQVLHTYSSPIFSPAMMKKEDIDALSAYAVIDKPLKYRGNHTYIGIVGTEGIDYKADFLRKANGDTRIACIWEQESGDQGSYYTSVDINKELAKGEVVNPPNVEQKVTQETLILEMAAGKSQQYEGIATEAEFLVSKIKSAPPDISKIYGGLAEESSVLMPDILIAVSKMIELAHLNNRPIVIYIPYNTNLSIHDGTSAYERILDTFAMEEGVTVIVPSGEEGDKAHHGVLLPSSNESNEIMLTARAETESVVGIIYMHSVENQPLLLMTPDKEEESLRLDEKGVYKRGETIIYSSGIQYNYQNGIRYILFSLEHMAAGNWRLVGNQIGRDNGKIELWLAQQAINPYVTFKTSNPFSTLGSNAALNNVISVASFDIKNWVVLGSSGRGDEWNNRIKPVCASQSMNPVVYKDKWKNVQGTAVAASILVGAIATIYEKWEKEQKMPYPNSLIINNLILGYLTQFSGETYPNRGQGYGVFQVETLPELLEKPMD